jgi:uncharacterized membrane protein YkvA (DUF1232 family)
MAATAPGPSRSFFSPARGFVSRARSFFSRASSFFSRAKRRARRMERQLWALYLCLKDPATPPAARVAILCAIAYSASPIDLIPDFIPVLGLVDDLVIVPALIALALRLIPREVAARSRREAYRRLASGERVRTPAAIAASVLFVAAWLALAAWLASRFL